MKKSKTMIVVFLAPAVLSFLCIFAWPVLRTIYMSFFNVENITSDIDFNSFVGFGNYANLFSQPVFWKSMENIAKIWFFGGVITLAVSLLFAVILTSGVRGKSFFRAVIYLPNVISAVALATMWMQFVFNKRYGLFNAIVAAFGGKELNWLDSEMKFWSMLIAFIFGAVGYYMLIFLSGIERIPADLYEAATIDGENKVGQFFHITLPLLKGVFKTNITFWTINTVIFFLWSKMFSPVNSEMSTVTPVVYMFNIVFGGKGVTERSAGRGAAVGVVLALIVLLVFFLFNKLIKEEDVEF